MINCATQYPEEAIYYFAIYIQRKGVGTLAYYLVEALLLLRVLDCPPYVISKAHTKKLYKPPVEEVYNPDVGVPAHYPYGRIVQIPTRDNLAKRPFVYMSFQLPNSLGH